MPEKPERDAVVANPLRARGLIDQAGLEKARAYQKEKGGQLSDAILRLNLVKEGDFLRAFAELYSARFVKADKLKSLKVDDAVLDLVNVRLCEQLRLCPIRYDREHADLHVVAAPPLSSELEPELRRLVGAKVVSIYVATAGAVHALIRRWHYRQADAFSDLTANGASSVSALLRRDDEDDTEPERAGVQRPRTASRDDSALKTVMVHVDEIAAQQAPALTARATPAASQVMPGIKDADVTISTLRKENARYRITQEFHRRVNQERTLEAMIDRILSVVFELLPAEGAAIHLTSGKLETKARRAGQAVNVPQSILDRALLSPAGLLTNNALVDERFDRSQSVILRGVQSVMAVPLRTRNRTLGVLYVDSVSQTAAFSDEDLPLLESIAFQAAILLDNAELIQKVQAEVENRINLSRFMSRAAVDEVLAGNASVKLDGTAAEVTVLFADIRGFTKLSAALRPEEVVRFLNRFFEEMVEAVEQCGGTVDKFIGDCVMALWGAPLPRPDDPRNAMLAALSMIERSRKIDVMGRPLTMGIGINTGEVVLGSIGSKQRLDYTAIGSAVNVAARLCSICKEGEILVTADTMMRAGAGVFADANEPVVLKGIDKPIVPYTLKTIGSRPIQLSAAMILEGADKGRRGR